MYTPRRTDLTAHAFYFASEPAEIMQRLAFYRLDDYNKQPVPGVALVPSGDYVFVAMLGKPEESRRVTLRGIPEEPEAMIYITDPERLVVRRYLDTLFAKHRAPRGMKLGRYAYARAPLEPFLAALRRHPKPERSLLEPDIGALAEAPTPGSKYLMREQREQAVRAARGSRVHVMRDGPAPEELPDRPTPKFWSDKDLAVFRDIIDGKM